VTEDADRLGGVGNPNRDSGARVIPLVLGLDAAFPTFGNGILRAITAGALWWTILPQQGLNHVSLSVCR